MLFPIDLLADFNGASCKQLAVKINDEMMGGNDDFQGWFDEQSGAYNDRTFYVNRRTNTIKLQYNLETESWEVGKYSSQEKIFLTIICINVRFRFYFLNLCFR